MLDILRKNSQHWVIKILFGLLALSFAAWGIGDMFRMRAATQPALVVGKTEFLPSQIVEDFRRQAERLVASSGGRITIDQARKMGVLQDVIDQDIARALLQQEVARLKLTVDEKLVIASIAGNPNFQIKGQFDRGLYAQMLSRNNMSEGYYEQEQRNGLLGNALLQSITSGISVPAPAVDALFRYAFEQRTAETILIPVEKMPSPGKPDDQILQTFYKSHQTDFLAPEMRGITAIILRPADVAAGISPAESDIEKLYQARQAEFMKGESRAVKIVTFADEAKAKDFAAKASLKDFVTLAKAGNLDITDLGTAEAKAMPMPEIGKAAFALPQPGVTGAIQSALGWHVALVSAITPGKSVSLADARDQLIKELIKAEAQNRLFKKSTDLEDAIGSGAALEEAANTVGAKLQTFAPVDASGRAMNGRPLDGLPSQRGFLEAAFKTDQGSGTQVEELEDKSGYYVLRVDSVTPPAAPALDAIKDRVAAAWDHEERSRAARKMAEELQKRLGKGEPLAAVAGSLPTETTQPFRRVVAPDSPILPALASSMFKAQPGGAAVIDVPNGDAMVARLKTIQPADPQAQPEQFANARAQYGRALSGDLLWSYRQALQKDLGVKINQSLIDQQFEK